MLIGFCLGKILEKRKQEKNLPEYITPENFHKEEKVQESKEETPDYDSYERNEMYKADWWKRGETYEDNYQ